MRVVFVTVADAAADDANEEEDDDDDDCGDFGQQWGH